MVSRKEIHDCLRTIINELHQEVIKEPISRVGGAFPNGPFYDSDGNTLVNDITYPLDKLLLDDQMVVGVLGKSCRDGGTGSYNPIHISHLVASLITTSLETGDINFAIDEMMRVISSNIARGAFIAILSGIRVDDEICINDDMRLVPIAQVPHSSNKKYLLDKSNVLSDITSAIITEYDINDFYFDPQKSNPVNVSSANKVQTARRIADALMVFTNSSGGIVAEWNLIIDAGSPRFNEIMIRLDPLVAYTSALQTAAIKPSDIVSMKDALLEWLSFSGDYDPILLTCARLRRSGRGMHAEDRAIDLGVALEVLLSGKLNSTQELSHRLALRGAWLLGHDANERLAISQNLKSLYDMRSKAVHTGRVSGTFRINNEKLVAFQALEKGRELCNKLLQPIIRKGEWPNWDLMSFGG